MKSTESRLHLSWVWILLCRTEFIYSPPWSSCITVRHIHKGQTGCLVRSSLLVSHTSTLLTAIEAFQIQIFGRSSLKKMHFPNPIIHALNDSNNEWKNNILSSKSFQHIKKCFFTFYHLKFQEIQMPLWSESFNSLSRVPFSPFNCIFTIANKVKRDRQRVKTTILERNTFTLPFSISQEHNFPCYCSSPIGV